VSDLDRRIIRGSAWLALSYGGGQLVSLVSTAVLAHFLAPSAFGVVALASVAIVAVTTLQESGLGLAMIHKRDEVERAAGTTLVFSVVMGLLLYAAAFFVAPLLAHIFRQPSLTNVIRVLATLLIARGIGMVPGVLIERELRFRARAKGELTGAAVQAAVAIPLAVAGAGVWSLVAAQVASAGVTSLVYWLLAPFIPSPRLFSWPLLRELGRFGRYVTAANILALIDQNVDTATVGRLLGAADVGYYNLAWRLCNLPATGIGYVLGRVMFPAYATMRDDLEAFRATFLTNVRRVALASLPIGVGILIAAEPIVVGIFGAKWRPAVVPLQILAVFGIVRSFAGTTGAVFQASGRPQIVTWLNVLHLAVLCAGLFTLTPRFGLNGAADAVTAAALVTLVVSYRYALRILELPFARLTHEVARPLICSVPLAVTLAAILVGTRGVDSGTRLAILIVGGACVYAATLATVARREVSAIAAALRS
jgi:O-antigen/teichoic acid export membrane protein